MNMASLQMLYFVMDFVDTKRAQVLHQVIDEVKKSPSQDVIDRALRWVQSIKERSELVLDQDRSRQVFQKVSISIQDKHLSYELTE